MDAFVELWNNHRIRPTRNDTLVCGKPSFMYECPEAYATNNKKHSVDQAHIDACKDEEICRLETECPCDEDMFEVCVSTMETMGANPPDNPREALLLYNQIRPIVRALIEG